MALSSTESELLIKTCSNMNVAANTCREVLEMLRSLGNTGVVDIATHNTSLTPHEDAENLVHVNSSGTAFLGEIGSIPAYSTYAPHRWEKQANTSSYRLFQLGDTRGNRDAYIQNRHYMAMTDSSGAKVSSSNFETYMPGDGMKGVYNEQIIADMSDCTPTINIRAYLGTYADRTQYDKIYYAIAMPSATFVWDATAFMCLSSVALGSSSYPFSTAYLNSAAIVTSDSREKSGVTAIGSDAVEFIKALRPVEYTVKNSKTTVLDVDESSRPVDVETAPGVRRHWGLIAQEVQEALASAGYAPSDCAVWSLADKDDPDSKQAIRYEELIAPLIKTVQVLAAKVEALEAR